jgi:hypothetical protein
VVLNVLDDVAWQDFLATLRPAFEKELAGETLPDADDAAWKQLKETLQTKERIMAFLAPRGVGPTAWDQSERKQIQHRRRFYLLGQTLDGMRVWDVRRGIQLLQEVAPELSDHSDLPICLDSQRQMAGVATYASLFESPVMRLVLHDAPCSHRDGPYLLNVRRILDFPQAVAMAAERSEVVVHGSNTCAWNYARQVARQLEWDSRQLQFGDE